MGDWNLFFAASAGSAATPVGLLFVATQLHLDVFKDPKSRWRATGSIGLLRGTSDSLLTVGSSFLILFGIAMRNAWRLVVSVAQESG